MFAHYTLFLHLTDLMVLGGLDLSVSKYLSHDQSGLRWRAADLIASCAQNMPQVQVHLLGIGALPKLLKLAESDPHPTVRVKALFAVSCKYPTAADIVSLFSNVDQLDHHRIDLVGNNKTALKC